MLTIYIYIYYFNTLKLTVKIKNNTLLFMSYSLQGYMLHDCQNCDHLQYTEGPLILQMLQQ